MDHWRERPCRTKPPDEYAFVTYIEELNLFSVVLLKRVTDIDSLNYGLLRDKGKPHRVYINYKGMSIKKIRGTISLCWMVIGRKWRKRHHTACERMLCPTAENGLASTVKKLQY